MARSRCARPIQRAIRSIVRDMDGKLMAAPRTLQSDDRRAVPHVLEDGQLVLLLGCVAVLQLRRIYGVVSFAVSQRTRESESAWRWARRKLYCSFVLRSGVRPIIAGLAVGGYSAGGSGALAEIVKDTQMAFDTRDPITYIVVSLLFDTAALDCDAQTSISGSWLRCGAGVAP